MRDEPLAFPSESRQGFWLLSFIVLASACSLNQLPAWFIAFLLGAVQSIAPGQADGFLSQVMSGALFTAVFFVVHVVSTRRLIRKYLLGPQSSSQQDDARRVLAKARETGLDLSDVVFTASLRDTRALTFRTLARKVLVLGGGLRLLRKKSESRFWAIAFHEFGHVINGDVWLTQVARSLVVTSIILCAFNLLYQLIWFAHLWLQNLPGYLRYGWSVTYSIWINIPQVFLGSLKVVLLTIAILVLYRKFLRDREFAADRVAALLGAAEPLRLLFEDAAASRTRWWRRGLATHPELRDRRSNLLNGFAYWRVDYLAMFSWGFVFSMSLAAEARLEFLGEGAPGVTEVWGSLTAIFIMFAVIVAVVNHLERSSYFLRVWRGVGMWGRLRTISIGVCCLILGMVGEVLLEGWISGVDQSSSFKRPEVVAAIELSLFFLVVAAIACAMVVPVFIQRFRTPRRPRATIGLIRILVSNAALACSLIVVQLVTPSGWWDNFHRSVSERMAGFEDDLVANGLLTLSGFRATSIDGLVIIALQIGVHCLLLAFWLSGLYLWLKVRKKAGQSWTTSYTKLKDVSHVATAGDSKLAAV